MRGTQGYAEIAGRLLQTRLDFAVVHAPYLHLIPTQPSNVLDIGSGPGHDAATFSEQGHAVVACEPTAALRAGAVRLYGSEKITWLDDGLPELETVRALGRRFDFILMSGVWMHLDAAQRRAAMPRVSMLLAEGGVLALSLRHGRVPRGRRMFPVSASETTLLAAQAGLERIVCVERESIQATNQAARVTWTILAFRTLDS